MQEVDLAHSHALEAEAQVSSAQQRVQAAESRYQSAIADTAHEAALVEYTRIVAPFDGVVTQRYASDGAMIQAGTSSQTQAMPIVKGVAEQRSAPDAACARGQRDVCAQRPDRDHECASTAQDV